MSPPTPKVLGNHNILASDLEYTIIIKWIWKGNHASIGFFFSQLHPLFYKMNEWALILQSYNIPCAISPHSCFHLVLPHPSLLSLHLYVPHALLSFFFLSSFLSFLAFYRAYCALCLIYMFTAFALPILNRKAFCFGCLLIHFCSTLSRSTFFYFSGRGEIYFKIIYQQLLFAISFTSFVMPLHRLCPFVFCVVVQTRLKNLLFTLWRGRTYLLQETLAPHQFWRYNASGWLANTIY